IRAFAALGSLTSGVVLAHALWVDPVFWSVLRVLTGLCFAGLATVVESWMNGRATREIRGRLLAVLSVAAIGGYAVGPLFATLASVDGTVLFIVASILMSVALVPVTVTRFHAPPLPESVSGENAYSLRRLFRETPLGGLGCLLTGVLQGAFLGLGAVFARRLGLSDAGASVFMTAALLSGAVCQYPLGWVSDLVDRRLVIGVFCLVLGVAAFVLVGMVTAGPPGVAVIGALAFVAGAAAMPLYSVVIAHINDRLPEPSILPAAASLILTFCIGSAIAGPLASAAMDLLGDAGLPLLLALTLCLLGAFSVLRVRLRERPAPCPEDEQVYVPGPALSPFDMMETPAQAPVDGAQRSG
ncbi:MAG: MFS transporter, partial [Gammaproteobacteria bacterium]|nr:MFS transporter [Gammaproteobacteria bacterium]